MIAAKASRPAVGGSWPGPRGDDCQLADRVTKRSWMNARGSAGLPLPGSL